MLKFLTLRAQDPQSAVNNAYSWRLKIARDFGEPGIAKFDKLQIVSNLEKAKFNRDNSLFGKHCYQLLTFEQKYLSLESLGVFLRIAIGLNDGVYDLLNKWKSQNDIKKLASIEELQKKYDLKMTSLAQQNEPLVKAVNYEAPYIIKELLAFGANPNGGIRTVLGLKTFLQSAMDSQRDDILKLLLEAGANPNYVHGNSSQWTPLFKAVNLENVTCIRLLLKYNADINCEMMNGLSIYSMAQWSGNAEVFAVIESHVTGRDEKEIISKYSNIKSIIERIVVQVFDVIHLSARSGNVKDLAKQLSLGVAVDERDSQNSTPLMWATASDKDAIVTLLLEKGADLLATNDFGYTALQIANRRCCPKSFVILLSALLEKSKPEDLTQILSDNSRISITPSTIWAHVSKKLNHVDEIERLASEGNALSRYLLSDQRVSAEMTERLDSLTGKSSKPGQLKFK